MAAFSAFSAPPAIMAIMERWAHVQPLDLPTDLHGVELIWQRLDLAGLYARLLAESCYEDRKNLSYIGGIRVGPGDVGWPSLYAGIEHYALADGSQVSTRDPGDALWASFSTTCRGRGSTRTWHP